MSKLGVRTQKSRSMMLSLYGLSGLAALVVFLFIFSTLSHIVVNINPSEFGDLGGLWVQSFLLVLAAMLLCFPFSLAASYLLVSRVRTQRAPLNEALMYLVGQTPSIFFGLIFLYFFAATELAIVLTLAFIATTQLARRWTEVSVQVPFMQKEAIQALGVGPWRTVYLLYVKAFYIQYVSHFLAVMCSLFMITTPLLCIYFYTQQSPEFFTIAFYKNLGLGSAKTASFALVLLLTHSFRFWLDCKANFWEAEYG